MKKHCCKILLPLMVYATFLLFSSNPLAAMNYNFTPIPSLVGGGWVAIRDINNNGQVVGESMTVGEERHAAIWDSVNGTRDLGTLGGRSRALKINDSGQVVGSYWAGGVEHAFIWDSVNGMQDLGALGGPASKAYDINDSEQVVGCESDQAFVWDSVNGIHHIGRACISQDMSINNSGQVVASAYGKSGDYGYMAFIWDETNGRRWLNIPGHDSNACVINDSGYVIGEFNVPGEHWHIYVWNETEGYRDLGEGNAYDMNNLGQFVGFLGTSGNEDRILWDLNTDSILHLQELFDADPNWKKGVATAINDLGWMAGEGITTNGDHGNFLITPNTIFIDVPPGYWAEEAIYKIYNAGITQGCSQNPLRYCPEGTVTRTQMAVFLGRAKHGSSFTPPSTIGYFSDVPVSYWAADWIEQFYRDGITSGCGTNPPRYCPYNPVTRTQMAVFLLRVKHGGSYTPPAATGIFDDVPLSHWAVDWIEQLYNEGITTGCGTGPLRYCPENSVTRAQMAVFIMRTFGL